ncbi:MAG: lamin tail domain-containing protein [Myxococcota bacterium]
MGRGVVMVAGLMVALSGACSSGAGDGVEPDAELGADLDAAGGAEAEAGADAEADGQPAPDDADDAADPQDAEVSVDTDADAGDPLDGETASDAAGPDDTAPDQDTAAETEVVSGTGEVVLNEVSAGGTDLIELVNRGDAPQLIGGWRVFDGAHSLSKSYVFPAGTVIAAGAYLVMKKGQQHEFGLGTEDGVFLERADGSLVDSTAWPKGMAEVSWCRFPDRVGAFAPCSTATPGTANIDVSDAVIVAPLWTGGGLSATVSGPDYETLDELCFDSAGRIWVADVPVGKIHVYEADGTFLESVGGVGTGPGQFLGLESLRPTPDGRIGAVDRSRKNIQFFDAETRAFVGVVPCSGCKDPVGLAFLTTGETLVVEQSPNRVLVLDAAGLVTDGFQIGTGATSILSKPETLAVDEATNRLLVTSEIAARVEVFDLAERTWRGQHIGDRQSGALAEPGRFLGAVEGIAVDRTRGLLFMSDEDNGRILVHALDDVDALYDPAANFAFLGTFGRLGAAPGEMASVDGLAVDEVGGRLGVADEGNNRVQVFDIDAILTALGLGAAQ